jgi:hypothetical protein
MMISTMIRSARMKIAVEVHIEGIHKVGPVVPSDVRMMVCAYIHLLSEMNGD